MQTDEVLYEKSSGTLVMLLALNASLLFSNCEKTLESTAYKNIHSPIQNTVDYQKNQVIIY